MRINHCIANLSVFRLLTIVPVMLVALTAITSKAHADIVDYYLVKILLHEQTADNTVPGTLAAAGIAGNLYVDNNNDFTSASVSGGAGFALSPLNGGLDWEGLQAYSSQAELDAAFPDGSTYTIDASGPLGTFSESVSFDSNGSFPNTPFFTNTVFSDAQGMDSSQQFAFTWNTPPAADDYHLFIEDASGDIVFYLDGIGDTSGVLPAGTLVAGADYRAHIGFFDLTNDNRDSFLTGAGASGYLNESFFEFTTSVPEPSSFAITAFSLIGIATRRRRKQQLA